MQEPNKKRKVTPSSTSDCILTRPDAGPLPLESHVDDLAYSDQTEPCWRLVNSVLLYKKKRSGCFFVSWWLVLWKFTEEDVFIWANGCDFVSFTSFFSDCSSCFLSWSWKRICIDVKGFSTDSLTDDRRESKRLSCRYATWYGADLADTLVSRLIRGRHLGSMWPSYMVYIHNSVSCNQHMVIQRTKSRSLSRNYYHIRDSMHHD